MAKKAAKKPAKEEKKKAKTTPAKKEKPAKKAKSKKLAPLADDGLVIIDEKFEEDKEAELEARKAYLEEARSQEVED